MLDTSHALFLIFITTRLGKVLMYPFYRKGNTRRDTLMSPRTIPFSFFQFPSMLQLCQMCQMTLYSHATIFADLFTD